uniref:Mitotic-spindle organizing protein associated with a ring of gamma-tubulin 1 n=1 Tax=Strongyloides papillosus TaxID=174720 RepID=A0A0N5BAW8_STREA
MAQPSEISKYTIDVISDTASNIGLSFTEAQIKAIVFAINNGHSAKKLISVLSLGVSEETNSSSVPFNENK